MLSPGLVELRPEDLTALLVEWAQILVEWNVMVLGMSKHDLLSSPGS